MKVAIVGAGLSGSYLAKLLSKYDINFTLYTQSPNLVTKYDWVATQKAFSKMCEEIDYSWRYYKLVKVKQVSINNHVFKSKDLITINLPQLLKDLHDDTNPQLKHIPYTFNNSDIVVDATGSRYILNYFTHNVKLAYSYQALIKLKEAEDTLTVKFDARSLSLLQPLGDSTFSLITFSDTLKEAEATFNKTLKELSDIKIIHVRLVRTPYILPKQFEINFYQKRCLYFACGSSLGYYRPCYYIAPTLITSALLAKTIRNLDLYQKLGLFDETLKTKLIDNYIYCLANSLNALNIFEEVKEILRTKNVAKLLVITDRAVSKLSKAIDITNAQFLKIVKEILGSR